MATEPSTSSVVTCYCGLCHVCNSEENLKAHIRPFGLPDAALVMVYADSPLYTAIWTHAKGGTIPGLYVRTLHAVHVDGKQYMAPIPRDVAESYVAFVARTYREIPIVAPGEFHAMKTE